MELKSLENVLTDICEDTRKRGIPLCTKKFKLFIWTDTIDCKPVIGTLDLNFNCSIVKARVIDILRNINALFPISMIEFKYNRYSVVRYHVSKTEEFMRKPCEKCCK
jgi:hypothetical protein